MTSAEQVYRFLKNHRGDGFCDDCLENLTGIDRHDVQTITETLSLYRHEFSRKRAVCPQHCSNLDKQITSSI
jgi:hypothetical protein